MTDRQRELIAEVKRLYGDGRRCAQSDPYAHVLFLAHDLALELEKALEALAEVYPGSRWADTGRLPGGEEDGSK